MAYSKGAISSREDGAAAERRRGGEEAEDGEGDRRS